MSEEAAAAESPAAAEAAKREASGAGDALARARWSNKREQLLSMSALIIGLGNIWRFPYLCYRNGGATFLVPYFLLLLFLGLPLFFLETALGQFTSQGAVTAWRRICPMLEGVGVASLVVLIYLNIYYIVVMAWTIFYFVHSFKDPLPWSTCDNSWNSELCQAHQSVYANPHLYQPNASWSFLNNISLEEYFINSTEYGFEQYRITSEDEFWTNRVLRVRDSMAIGAPHWDLALCLLLAWIICYFCIFKGIRLSGKVVYVTATLPYLLMFILFVRGVTLPGAGTGLRYFLVPSFSKLADLDVWQEAASQVIFSHAVGHGVLTSMSSYNTYNNNCYRSRSGLHGLPQGSVAAAGPSFLDRLVLHHDLPPGHRLPVSLRGEHGHHHQRPVPGSAEEARGQRDPGAAHGWDVLPDRAALRHQGRDHTVPRHRRVRAERNQPPAHRGRPVRGCGLDLRSGPFPGQHQGHDGRGSPAAHQVLLAVHHAAAVWAAAPGGAHQHAAPLGVPVRARQRGARPGGAGPGDAAAHDPHLRPGPPVQEP
ncbi:sodium- and chloride-dependent betaine transporter-like isoform X2 [Synchiropus splendidus]|uniref:sodium- and chloride-dependent betaine transporter-like isoform X2 n=1 Tax=Synchiropus splendidus TaxID=270530 RepID=UPI00237E42E9|nr:sodium- and chloride-dependent betaine transporter-like isoform X2 [Synchiropus splendidus]